MYLVPDLPDVDNRKADAIAKRLRAFDFSIKLWEGKRDQAQQMVDEFVRAREAFIAHLPDLPVWITERGEIGACDPDDAA